jgi:hypothetical protein
VDLERACQGRTATDIDDLQTYVTTGAGNVVDLIRRCAPCWKPIAGPPTRLLFRPARTV